jgi:subtilisin family serine protease
MVVHMRRHPARRLAAVVAVLAVVVVNPLLPVPGASAGASDGQPRTWNFTQATVPTAQTLGFGGAGATVAVVDTWIDGTHPDLRNRVIGAAHCVGQRGRCLEGAQRRDACAHGTHVAGTVASARYGVAPRAGILAVQVLSHDPDSGCSGTAGDVAAGIRFAAGKGSDVINLSLGALVPGLFQNHEITAAVHDAARSGVVVIFAAGNSGLPLTDSYGSDALIIAATGPDGSIASYSARGGSVALAAPGGDTGRARLSGCGERACILSTAPDSSYQLMQGTSMAAPHVAGAAALLVAQRPRRGRADVITSLTSTARPLSGGGNGLLDATAALRRRAEAGVVAPAARPTAAAPNEPRMTRTPPAEQHLPPATPTARGGTHTAPAALEKATSAAPGGQVDQPTHGAAGRPDTNEDGTVAMSLVAIVALAAFTIAVLVGSFAKRPSRRS